MPVKRRLAAAALELVTPGQTILIDDSTTCLYLAQRLPERAPITVVTHFLALIKVLAGQPGVNLVALGGTYYPSYDAFFGVQTVDAVAGMRADLLFMSPTAVTHGRCYNQTHETVAVERAMIDVAARPVLLADHTKFTRQGLYLLAPLTAFDTVLVDPGLPTAELRGIRELGARVHVVGSSR
ncbi:DeoR/GlpR family DNA-binding transcription regulator [Mycobacterium hubeiense]|uniref:DeoR/GlpR family DNA-binding transcription regulator n=1 Tax=Mycobacterium hubeiense TaxID=1867256 RepID=UPI000C7F4234|nr:hypothetical protein [Mycobacterium sp. QGD 101]